VRLVPPHHRRSLPDAAAVRAEGGMSASPRVSLVMSAKPRSGHPVASTMDVELRTTDGRQVIGLTGVRLHEIGGSRRDHIITASVELEIMVGDLQFEIEDIEVYVNGSDHGRVPGWTATIPGWAIRPLYEHLQAALGLGGAA
jgi:hypothetical protein